MAASPLKSIITSLRGRKLGFDNLGGLILNKPNGDQEGCTRVVTVASADLLALNATPQTIIPAPAAGYANILRRALLRKPAGTAYAGVAAGEDLILSYTNGAGQEVARVETTGFLDQATAQVRMVNARSAAAAVGDITPVAAAAIVLSLLSGEITTGDSNLIVKVWYDVLNLSDLS